MSAPHDTQPLVWSGHHIKECIWKDADPNPERMPQTLRLSAAKMVGDPAVRLLRKKYRLLCTRFYPTAQSAMTQMHMLCVPFADHPFCRCLVLIFRYRVVCFPTRLVGRLYYQRGNFPSLHSDVMLMPSALLPPLLGHDWDHGHPTTLHLRSRAASPLVLRPPHLMAACVFLSHRANGVP